MDATYKVSISRHKLSQKIPQGDPFWNDFNGSFENIETDTGNILQALYEGKPVTTWHKDHWRTGANYIAGQHLGLDFDHGQDTLESLAQDKFIIKYGAFIYNTMSHTPEAPRCRAMFLLDQPIVQAKNYSLAANALLWTFGTADRACHDSVRFWYGSPGCHFIYIDRVLPLDVIKKMIANYQDTGARERKKTMAYDAPATQQEVSDALKMIPAWDIPYDEWLSVLMAIHSQFGDAGYMLAESWGQGKGDEIERKFKSFDQGGNESGAVTIATLFGIAKRFGWRKSA